jgi:hypothetical protein
MLAFLGTTLFGQRGKWIIPRPCIITYAQVCLFHGHAKLIGDLVSPPIRSKTKHDGYCTIASNLPRFQAINELPLMLNPESLDEGDGILETLQRRNAKYHMRCRLMFNNTKLERPSRRASFSEPSYIDDIQNKALRRRSIEAVESKCFLCEKEVPASTLRQAMTMQLNERLNKCAQTLNDGERLRKFSGGDVVDQEMKYHPTCLVRLYNRQRAAIHQHEQSNKKNVYTLAFPDLLS